jgi:hypothetical protein
MAVARQVLEDSGDPHVDICSRARTAGERPADRIEAAEPVHRLGSAEHEAVGILQRGPAGSPRRKGSWRIRKKLSSRPEHRREARLALAQEDRWSPSARAIASICGKSLARLSVITPCVPC